MNRVKDSKIACFVGGVVVGGIGLYLLGKLSGTKSIKKREGGKDAKKTEHSPKDREAMEKLMREQLVRNYQYFGEEAQEKIRKSFVVVVGCGGVGSHVVNMLVRSGVSKLRVIDFDMVSLSSLNRHALAFREDVGKSKVDVLFNYLTKLNPLLDMEVVQSFFSKDNQDHMLKGQPDIVVDCIDDIESKIDLIRYCVVNKIPIVSSGGAGAKCDPTKIQIRDISETNCSY